MSVPVSSDRDLRPQPEAAVDGRASARAGFSQPDGGAAFPGVPEGKYFFTGMSMRDYFAAKTLGVMCSSNVKHSGTFATPEGRETVALICYYMADAMLRARTA